MCRVLLLRCVLAPIIFKFMSVFILVGFNNGDYHYFSLFSETGGKGYESSLSFSLLLLFFTRWALKSCSV